MSTATETPPAATDEAARPNPFAARFVTPLFLGSALNPINSSLIATALVPIAHGIHVSVGQTATLVSALYLASAVAQPTAGKLAEVIGPRRVFLAGICLVLLGGILGGVGRSLAALTVARVLIGLGTSAGYPTAMLMIRRRAEHAGLPGPPGNVLGGLQIAGTATAALGLPIGGVIVDGLGWRSTFLINVPVALIALGFAALWLPRDPARTERLRAADLAARIDLAGIALFGATMVALLVFLDRLPTPHWGFLGLAGLFGIALGAWELRPRRPFFDVRALAHNPSLTRTYLRFALTSVCVYTVLYGLTDWLEVAHGLSSRSAGLLILPMTGLSALVMRPISQRNLVRPALIAAAVASILGSIGIALLRTSSPTLLIVGVTLLFGVTLGCFASGNQTALYTQADAAQIGTAAGLLRTFGYLGSIASSAIVAVFFHASVSDHGLHTIALIMTGVSVALLALTVLDRRLHGPAPSPSTERPRR